MKNTLIIGLMILCIPLFGQIPGKPIEGPIVFFDTLFVKVGDIISLGNGSESVTGNFRYLYIPKDKTVNTLYNIFSNNSDLNHKVIPNKNLDKGFAGKQLVIKSFSKVTSKKTVNKILGVINMKDYQFTEGIFFNNVVVDIGPAILSGEIIKISAPELAEKARQVEPLSSLFEMTRKGIEPVVVVFKNVSKNELYTKAIKWTNAYYEIPTTATITTVQDNKITIKDKNKNVQIGKLMGNDLFGDLPYQFEIDFSDYEIKMTFTLGGKNGDITAENGEVIANISPSSIFDKNGEVRKMSQILKVEAEKIMNDLSYALVNYLMK